MAIKGLDFTTAGLPHYSFRNNDRDFISNLFIYIFTSLYLLRFRIMDKIIQLKNKACKEFRLLYFQ